MASSSYKDRIVEPIKVDIVMPTRHELYERSDGKSSSLPPRAVVDAAPKSANSFSAAFSRIRRRSLKAWTACLWVKDNESFHTSENGNHRRR